MDIGGEDKTAGVGIGIVSVLVRYLLARHHCITESNYYVYSQSSLWPMAHGIQLHSASTLYMDSGTGLLCCANCRMATENTELHFTSTGDSVYFCIAWVTQTAS